MTTMNINNILNFDIFHHLFSNFLSDRLGWLRIVHPIWRDVINSLTIKDKRSSLSLFVESPELIQYAKDYSVLVKWNCLSENMEKIDTFDPKKFLSRPFDPIDPLFVCKFIFTQSADKAIQFLDLIKNQPGFKHLIKTNQRWRKILIVILFSGNDQLFDWFDSNFELFDFDLKHLPKNIDYHVFGHFSQKKFQFHQFVKSVQRYPLIISETNPNLRWFINIESMSLSDLLLLEKIDVNNQISIIWSFVEIFLVHLYHCQQSIKTEADFIHVYNVLLQLCKSDGEEEQLKTQFFKLAILHQFKDQIKEFSNCEKERINFLEAYRYKGNDFKFKFFDLNMIDFVLQFLNTDKCANEFLLFLLYFQNHSSTDYIFERLKPLDLDLLRFYPKLIYCFINNNRIDILNESNQWFKNFIEQHGNQIESIKDSSIIKHCYFLIFWLRLQFDLANYQSYDNLKFLLCQIIANSYTNDLIDDSDLKSDRIMLNQSIDHLLNIVGETKVQLLITRHPYSSSAIASLLNHIEITPDFIKNINRFTVPLVEHCFHSFTHQDFVDLIPLFYRFENDYSKSDFTVILWLKDHEFYPQTNETWQDLLLHYLINNKLIEFCQNYSKIIKNPIPLSMIFTEIFLTKLPLSLDHIKIMYQSKLFNVGDIHKLYQMMDIHPFDFFL